MTSRARAPWFGSLWGIVLLSGTTAILPAQAQQATKPMASLDATEDVTDEIVVTARKREEVLQDVPISIATFSSEQLQAQGLRSDFDVSEFTVGFRTVPQTGRDADRPTIHGQANPGNRGESNASYFVDGVYVSSSIAGATTNSVKQVEILRGPQSAQFGRATFSGAVNYITRDPTEDYQGQVNTRAGTHDDYDAGGWFSGPLFSDKLLFLVSGDVNHYGGQWNNQLEAGYPGGGQDANGQPTGFTPGAARWAVGAHPVVWPDGTIVTGGIPAPIYAPNPTPGTVPDPNNPPTAANPWQQFAPTQADHSRLGEEETTDFLAKFVYRPVEGTDVTFKYGYTRDNDSSFPSLIAPEVNCYIPTQQNFDTYAAWKTSPGDFCGKFNAEGKINRINIPDLKYGVAGKAANGKPNPEDYIAAGAEPGTRRETNRFMLRLNQDLPEGFSLTATTAYNRDRFQQVFDLDHTEVRALWGLFTFDSRRFIEDKSFELRLDSPGDLPVRGSLGIYWYDQDRTNRIRSFVGPGEAAGTGNAQFPPATDLTTKNEAVFGAVDWDFAPQWTFSAEARYAEDKKSINGGALIVPIPPVSPNTYPDGSVITCDGTTITNCLGKQKLDFKNFTPRFTVRYEVDEDLTVYFLEAKGNKPGDFNSNLSTSAVSPYTTLAAIDRQFCEANQSPPYIVPCVPYIVEEEESWTSEVGLKGQWFDRRLTTNLAVYYIDWKNQGLFTSVIPTSSSGTPAGATTVITNAGKSEVKGIELETSYNFTENLSVLASYGYTDSRYVDAFDATTADTEGNYGAGNINGNYVPNVAKNTVILGANATTPIMPGYELFIRPDFSYSSKRYTTPSNHNWIGDTNLLNLRMGVQAEEWTTTFYVNNLLDDDTPVASLEFFNYGTDTLPNGKDQRLYSLNPRRGRDYGLEFQYRFK